MPHRSLRIPISSSFWHGSKAGYISGRLGATGGDALRSEASAPGLAGCCQLDPSHPADVEGANHVFGVELSGWPLPRSLCRAHTSARICGRCQQNLCPHSRRSCLCERRGSRICLDNLRSICSDKGYLTQGPVTTSVLGRGVFLVLIADYRGGVTCLYDTQLLGACLHASECGDRYRPEAVRGMPDVPIAPPATGPPEGWAAVGFASPASFNRGLWARLLRVLGSKPLILGSERVRIWVFDRFNPGLIRCQNRLADGHKSLIPKRLDCVP